MLGLLSLIMQLLLNRCSRLVSDLEVEVVNVLQLPASGYHCCREDENESLINTKKM